MSVAMNNIRAIDQLVKLGIIRRGARLPATDEPTWVIDEPQKFRLMTEEQVLSNNDVMAAVMVMVADEGFHTSFGSLGDYDCSVDHLENHERNYRANHENLTTAIILAGLQALQDV